MVHIYKNYYVNIDSNGNYTSRIDTHKMQTKKIIDKETKEEKEVEEKVYDTVGYYSDMNNAIKGIVKDMVSKRAREKSMIEIKEYLSILKEERLNLQKLLKEVDLY